MARYGQDLPQNGGELFLTDGGLETALIYDYDLELPDFAAFVALRWSKGREALRRYYLSFAEVAREFDCGLILESPTWRASADWGRRLGYSARELAAANRDAISLIGNLRGELPLRREVVLCGCLGPRGDGYRPIERMTAHEAQLYHGEQVEALADTAADMLSAMTLNYVEEAIGIARCAQHAALPVAISFTVETDGRLVTGQTLGEAIDQVDQATFGYPSYYQVNCAHPEHFEPALAAGGGWLERLRGLRANASRKSHAELNESTALDAGDPAELGGQYAALRRRLPLLNVLGGCCGTNHRHVREIAKACRGLS